VTVALGWRVVGSVLIVLPPTRGTASKRTVPAPIVSAGVRENLVV